MVACRVEWVTLRTTGKILRFDQAQGYGFIASSDDDVFLHINDLEMDKCLVKPGILVEFDVQEGEKGKYATGVRPSIGSPIDESPDERPENDAADPDELSDVLTKEEFFYEVTEIILQIAPTVSAEQILQIRSGLEAAARRHGWVET